MIAITKNNSQLIDDNWKMKFWALGMKSFNFKNVYRVSKVIYYKFNLLFKVFLKLLNVFPFLVFAFLSIFVSNKNICIYSNLKWTKVKTNAGLSIADKTQFCNFHTFLRLTFNALQSQNLLKKDEIYLSWKFERTAFVMSVK